MASKFTWPSSKTITSTCTELSLTVSRLNYDQLKDRKEWWAFKDLKRRDNNRGMLSIDLLRTIMQTDHLEPIDITTHGIFRTQFHDKFKSTDFKTLEFPAKYTSLFHPPRDGDGPYTGDGDTLEDDGLEEDEGEEGEADSEKAKKIIVACREKIEKHPDGAAILERLDSKIRKLKGTLPQPTRACRRSAMNNEENLILFSHLQRAGSRKK